MGKHTLFLLEPGFSDERGGPFFCPECAMVEWFLHYEPEIKNQLEVRRVAFKRPRSAIIEQLGAANQGCPVLVLSSNAEAPADAKISEETGKAFIAGPQQVCDYLARTFGGVRPHP